MPPPPPPSKSYLLVIEDSSSEDEDERDYRIHRRESPFSNTNPALESRPVTTDPGSRRRPIVITDEDDYDDEELVNTSTEADDGDDEESSSRKDDDDDSPVSTQKKLSKNQKKKRARRRKKKKSKACNTTDPTRRISFSTVSFRTYPRAFSEVSVPADGGWPLGLALEPLHEGAPADVSLEEFEAEKQQRLKERWEILLQSKNVDAKMLEQMTKRPDTGEPLALETRQWDYLNKMKNPLFGLLSEEQRQTIFLESSSDDAESQFPAKGRARSNSVTDSSNTGSSNHPKHRRGRSTSFSHTEHFNETYNQVYVHHVRNELEQLRIERTKSGATGCNCRKLTVYIPPKDGGGKKAQHRRLKPAKLTSELKKRNLYDESASREELERILHDAIEKEPCCSSEDCFCHRNGIDCQADACSCWHDSHVHSKSGGGYLSIKSIRERCGNPHGTTTVDADAIDSYRERVLESNLCQFIETAQ